MGRIDELDRNLSRRLVLPVVSGAG